MTTIAATFATSAKTRLLYSLTNLGITITIPGGGKRDRVY